MVWWLPDAFSPQKDTDDPQGRNHLDLGHLKEQFTPQKVTFHSLSPHLHGDAFLFVETSVASVFFLSPAASVV